MSFFKRHPPLALYRGTILLGCLAFLLGVAGIIYFQFEDRRGLPGRDAASVLVHGAEGQPGIEVVARWEIETTAETAPRWRSETGRLGDEPGIYLFHRAPDGVALELVVYRHGQGGRQELHRQPAILTYGQNIYTALPLAAPAGSPSGPSPGTAPPR